MAHRLKRAAGAKVGGLLDLKSTSPGNCTCRGSLHRENTHEKLAPARPKGAELGPSFKRAQAKREHLKGALLAERHARGPDGQRMRSPQLARCSRDQIRQRMAALARG